MRYLVRVYDGILSEIQMLRDKMVGELGQPISLTQLVNALLREALEARKNGQGRKTSVFIGLNSRATPE